MLVPPVSTLQENPRWMVKPPDPVCFLIQGVIYLPFSITQLIASYAKIKDLWLKPLEEPFERQDGLGNFKKKLFWPFSTFSAIREVVEIAGRIVVMRTSLDLKIWPLDFLYGMPATLEFGANEQISAMLGMRNGNCALGYPNGKVRIYTPYGVHKEVQYSSAVTCMTELPDGKIVVSCEDGQIYAPRPFNIRAVTCMAAFSGDQLLVGNRYGCVGLIDLNSAKPVTVLTLDSAIDRVVTLPFLQVLILEKNQRLSVWDPQERTLFCLCEGVTFVSAFPNGQFVASGGNDIWIWSSERKVLMELRERLPINFLRVCSQGEFIVTTSEGIAHWTGALIDKSLKRAVVNLAQIVGDYLFKKEKEKSCFIGIFQRTLLKICREGGLEKEISNERILSLSNKRYEALVRNSQGSAVDFQDHAFDSQDRACVAILKTPAGRRLRLSSLTNAKKYQESRVCLEAATTLEIQVNGVNVEMAEKLRERLLRYLQRVSQDPSCCNQKELFDAMSQGVKKREPLFSWQAIRLGECMKLIVDGQLRERVFKIAKDMYLVARNGTFQVLSSRVLNKIHGLREV